MLGKEPSEVTKPERQNIGKVTELALGFQGGVGAMMKMSGGRVDFTGMYESLCETMGSHQDKAAEAYKRRGEGLSREGWIAAEMMKLSWRALHPNIERFWWNMEEAAVSAVNGGVKSCHWGGAKVGQFGGRALERVALI